MAKASLNCSMASVERMNVLRLSRTSCSRLCFSDPTFGAARAAEPQERENGQEQRLHEKKGN